MQRLSARVSDDARHGWDRAVTGSGCTFTALVEALGQLLADDVRDDTRLMRVQVACDCGWRSRRYTAPLGTYWSPCSVQFPDEDCEDAAVAIWQAHRDDVGTSGDLWSLAHTLRFGPSASKVAP